MYKRQLLSLIYAARAVIVAAFLVAPKTEFTVLLFSAAIGVNELIARGAPTATVWITDEELDARPELVKTMSVQPPRGAGRVRLLRIEGIDLQPCGGTHVRDIGEIGRVRVLRIRNEGKRNKRVEIGFA